MSTPTPPAPSFDFGVSCQCNGCGKTLVAVTAHTEDEVKKAAASAITASEMHDCRSTPKK
jgi:hypothetical protein